MKKIIFALFLVILSFGILFAYGKLNNIKTNISDKGNYFMSDSITVAIIKTNMGTIEIELFADKTPKTVENFIGLAEKDTMKELFFIE